MSAPLKHYEVHVGVTHTETRFVQATNANKAAKEARRQIEAANPGSVTSWARPRQVSGVGTLRVLP